MNELGRDIALLRVVSGDITVSRGGERGHIPSSGHHLVFNRVTAVFS